MQGAVTENDDVDVDRLIPELVGQLEGVGGGVAPLRDGDAEQGVLLPTLLLHLDTPRGRGEGCPGGVG